MLKDYCKHFVVLDSSNMALRDEDKMLDQKHEKHINSDFYYDDFFVIYENAY